MKRIGNSTEKHLWRRIWLIMAAGLILRVVYILATPYYISPHDLGTITDSREITGGHLGYISYLLHYGHLPDFDPRTVSAFYNPPLFHAICAAWIAAVQWLGAAFFSAVSSLRVLTLAFCTVSIYLSVKISEALGVKGRSLLWVSVFLTFFPTFTWLSVTLASDGLVLMLMLLAMYCSVRWYQAPSMGRIVVLALAIGLGMMTKLNAGYLAFGTAFLFLARFVQAIKADRAKVWAYLGQFAVFAVICLPLGLFWPVRNYVLFGMPLSYIPRATQAQYIGDATLWARLGIPSLSQLSYIRVLFDTTRDTNIWLTMLRTALFDEQYIINFYSLPTKLLAAGLFLYSIVLALAMNVCYALCLIKKKYGLRGWQKTYSLLLYLPIMASYLVFCFQYPSICTMNYRYIAPLTVLPVLATGLVFNEEMRQTRPMLYKLFAAAMVLHAALSALIYLLYSFTLFGAA